MLEDWSALNAKLSFSRLGDSYDICDNIRPLTDIDSSAVSAVCGTSLQDENPYAAELARHFSNLNVSDCDKMLGLFNESDLVGFVEYDYIDILDLAVLENVFVSKEHRGEGSGKALVKAALSNHPAKKWAYDVWKHNTGSIALAESLGFEFEGAMILIK